jgi:hypothetical protein
MQRQAVRAAQQLARRPRRPPNSVKPGYLTGVLGHLEDPVDLLDDELGLVQVDVVGGLHLDQAAIGEGLGELELALRR